MVFTLLWTLFYLLGFSSQTLPEKILWLRIKYIPSTLNPIIWLFFSLQFTHSKRWLNNRILRISTISYVLFTWLVVFSSDFHGWMWQKVWIEPGLPEEAVIHGFYFWVYLGVSYLALFLSFIVYTRYFISAATIYKKQALTMVFGSVVPLFASILFLFFNLDLVPLLDESVLSFLFSGLFFAWSLFGFHSFELIPIAHELVIKNMTIGVLVFDSNNKIVEINPMAEKLLRISNDQAIGKPANMVFSNKEDIFVMNDIHEDIETEIESLDFDEKKYFSIHQSPILDRKNELFGRIMLITDITERKKHEIVLRNFATYDEMTKIFNRRHFYVMAEKEFLRAQRYQRPVSIAIFDIDNFKSFNDVYGHSLGDLVITHVAQTILKSLRDSDLIGRFGGDEFICLFPEINNTCAIKAINRLRDIMHKNNFLQEGKEFPITISFGLAHWNGNKDETIEEVIQHADMALLQAKRMGRDRSSRWDDESGASIPI